ncbi:MAG TPA: EutN/CcmL family microcompartment protein [Polyangia bacterium]|nr:EutN/CcmL family microcompartment protein [Polyangia bacterium]
MILGRVVGQVWATRRDPRLARTKLLVVRPHGIYEPALGTRHLVATDEVHAGIGDEVVVCLGKPARLSLGSNDTPVDAAILGVVDRIELDDASLPVSGAAPGIRRPLSSAAALLRAQVGR